jgi:beta-galactosidase
MAYKDETPEDGKGGFTDSGASNDLSGLPLGKQEFLGIPFEIVNPAENDEKSCLTLKGRERPTFPQEKTNIKIGERADKLFFLHTGGWIRHGEKTLEYIIHYSDGKSIKISVVGGQNIADWYNISDKSASNARIAWEKKGGKGYKGVFAYEWKNPYPGKTIDTMDIISCNNGVPVIIAITGEKTE